MFTGLLVCLRISGCLVCFAWFCCLCVVVSFADCVCYLTCCSVSVLFVVVFVSLLFIGFVFACLGRFVFVLCYFVLIWLVLVFVLMLVLCLLLFVFV